MAVIEDINDFFENAIASAAESIIEHQKIIIGAEKQKIYWESRKKAMQDAQALVRNYGG